VGSTPTLSAISNTIGGRMKNVFLILIFLCSMIFAETVIYTEGRFYSTADADGEVESTGATLEDRSKWTIDDDGEYFIHKTNTGYVNESTYWIEDGSVEEVEDGFTCIATSDAGITRRFYFTTEAVLIILETTEDGVRNVVTFNVKNIVSK
jgi:hypothetical protein